MVMHIVIPPAPKPEEEAEPVEDSAPVFWPPEDPDYDVIGDPRVCAAIKLWALLHYEPHSARELGYIIGMKRPSVSATLKKLRKRGQEIVYRPPNYHLVAARPLRVSNRPKSGVILGPERASAEYAHLEYEVRCEVVAGRLHLFAIDPPWEREPVEEPPPSARVVRWRPDGGPAGEGRYEYPPRSLPVWTWGLLKTRSRTLEELAQELGVSPERASQMIGDVRRRGHEVVRDVRGRYWIPDTQGPLLVDRTPGCVRIARCDGVIHGELVALW